MAAGTLGIDIGGSGIKGNLVDTASGDLLSDRFRIDTPQPSLPDAVADVVRQIAEHFEASSRFGCTFPAVVKGGVTLSAANVDKSWIGTDARALFSEATGLDVVVINDADAAGVAEMAFGAGRGRLGVVVLLTFGSGIGSAVFVDGVLVPNTEFGHLELRGHSPVEDWAAASVKDDKNLSWSAWAKRVDRFLHHLQTVVSPDLFIIGGGVSRKWDSWGALLTIEVETVPAALRNEAGIVGAALVASRSVLAERTRD
ncbi:MAG TPA: ROK family protein [Acidimicrobiia bacterium]|nr:ROK family protein [Acidimicrobiia bacterium]